MGGFFGAHQLHRDPRAPHHPREAGAPPLARTAPRAATPRLSRVLGAEAQGGGRRIALREHARASVPKPPTRPLRQTPADIKHKRKALAKVWERMLFTGIYTPYLVRRPVDAAPPLPSLRERGFFPRRRKSPSSAGTVSSAAPPPRRPAGRVRGERRVRDDDGRDARADAEDEAGDAGGAGCLARAAGGRRGGGRGGGGWGEGGGAARPGRAGGQAPPPAPAAAAATEHRVTRMQPPQIARSEEGHQPPSWSEEMVIQ